MKKNPEVHARCSQGQAAHPRLRALLLLTSELSCPHLYSEFTCNGCLSTVSPQGYPGISFSNDLSVSSATRYYSHGNMLK